MDEESCHWNIRFWVCWLSFRGVLSKISSLFSSPWPSTHRRWGSPASCSRTWACPTPGCLPRPRRPWPRARWRSPRPRGRRSSSPRRSRRSAGSGWPRPPTWQHLSQKRFLSRASLRDNILGCVFFQTTMYCSFNAQRSRSITGFPCCREWICLPLDGAVIDTCKRMGASVIWKTGKVY